VHSPQCIAAVAGLVTVPLPRRANVRTIDADGALGIAVHEGGAFWVSWPIAAGVQAALVITYEDGSTQTVNPAFGPQRFVTIERIANLSVVNWPTGVEGSAWLEELDALNSASFVQACRCSQPPRGL
jgi:hypothetical protein